MDDNRWVQHKFLNPEKTLSQEDEKMLFCIGTNFVNFFFNPTAKYSSFV